VMKAGLLVGNTVETAAIWSLQGISNGFTLGFRKVVGVFQDDTTRQTLEAMALSDRAAQLAANGVGMKILALGHNVVNVARESSNFVGEGAVTVLSEMLNAISANVVVGTGMSWLFSWMFTMWVRTNKKQGVHDDTLMMLVAGEINDFNIRSCAGEQKSDSCMALNNQGSSKQEEVVEGKCLPNKACTKLACVSKEDEDQYKLGKQAAAECSEELAQQEVAYSTEDSLDVLEEHFETLAGFVKMARSSFGAQCKAPDGFVPRFPENVTSAGDLDIVGGYTP